jgi:class 3 adenylate cyclase
MATARPGQSRPSSGEERERSLTAVLFVDIVEATSMAVTLGDAAWAELLERYHEVARTAIGRRRGRLMDTAGDGFFAIFDETEDAIHCALDIGLAVRPLGLELRSGVHLGHCWLADAKCAGADVHVGARLAECAAPGEVLVSEEVVARTRRAGIGFSDRGERALKGLPGIRRVFAIANDA